MAWKRTFIFSFMAQMLTMVGLSFATPFLPFYVAELGVKDTGAQAFWAGVVLSSAGLTFALFAPIWGFYADRYGRKLMVCRAMLGGGLALLLMSFARTPAQLALYRMFQGAFSGSLSASIALVASVVPQERSGLTLGMMQAAVFIGNAVGPFFGGVAADAFGYRVSFRLGAVLCLLGSVLVYKGTRETFTPAHARASVHGPGFKTILLLPGFLISVAVMFGVRFSNSMANPSFPLVIREIHVAGFNINSIAGATIAAAALAAAASAAWLGHVGDRLGRRRVVIACCLGACLASLGHYFARSMPALIAARVLFGFTVAGMLPAANAMIHSVVDTRSIGKAYGLATSLSMLGIAAGPFLGGVLGLTAGIRVPFLATAAAQGGMALLVMYFFHDRKRNPEISRLSV